MTKSLAATTRSALAERSTEGPLIQGAEAGLSPEDIAFAAFFVAIELSARDLYDIAIEKSDDELFGILREQHEAYAQRFSGLAGIPLYGNDPDVLSEYEPAFQAGGDEGIQAAIDLENRFAVEYAAIVPEIEDPKLLAAMASAAVMISRHAAILAHQEDAETQLNNKYFEEGPA